MKNKTCPLTMTGKHIWTDTLLKYSSIKIMCKACGMIDDRKKKNETKKLS